MNPPSPYRGRARQRVLVYLCVVLAALAAAAVPGFDRRGTTAKATATNPFSCGATDQNRQPVKMWDGLNSASDGGLGAVTPCVSGVTLTFNIPSNCNCGTLHDIRKLTDLTSVRFSDGTTASAVHIAFKDLQINSSAANVTLKTTAGMATSHLLTIAPDHEATIGGDGVITDVVADSSSTITLSNAVFLVPGVCLLAGGSGIFNPCPMTLGNLSGGLVALAGLVGINTFTIVTMNLKLYYLVTHDSSGNSPSAPALQLPNTSITVTGS